MLVGEQPNSTTDWDEIKPLGGMIAYRLMRWVGLPEDELTRPYAALTERFDVHNIFPTYRVRWSAPEARAAWNRYLLSRNCRETGERLVVIALGRRAAAAIGLSRPFYEWVEAGLLEVVSIPHPSTRNLIYNHPRQREYAGRVLQEALERAS